MQKLTSLALLSTFLILGSSAQTLVTTIAIRAVNDSLVNFGDDGLAIDAELLVSPGGENPLLSLLQDGYDPNLSPTPLTIHNDVVYFVDGCRVRAVFPATVATAAHDCMGRVIEGDVETRVGEGFIVNVLGQVDGTCGNPFADYQYWNAGSLVAMPDAMRGLAVDPSGTLYANRVSCMVSMQNGLVRNFAGTCRRCCGCLSTYGTYTGPGSYAWTGIQAAAVWTGNLYLAVTENCVVQVSLETRDAAPFAGVCKVAGNDEVGTAAGMHMGVPLSIVPYDSDYFFIYDATNLWIYHVSPSAGSMRVLAALDTPASPVRALVDRVRDTDHTQNGFLVTMALDMDRLRLLVFVTLVLDQAKTHWATALLSVRVDDGNVTLLAGGNFTGFSADGWALPYADQFTDSDGFGMIKGLIQHNDGSYFFIEQCGFPSIYEPPFTLLRRLVVDGDNQRFVLTTVAGQVQRAPPGGVLAPYALAVNRTNLFVADGTALSMLSKTGGGDRHITNLRAVSNQPVECSAVAASGCVSEVVLDPPSARAFFVKQRMGIFALLPDGVVRTVVLSASVYDLFDADELDALHAPESAFAVGFHLAWDAARGVLYASAVYSESVANNQGLIVQITVNASSQITAETLYYGVEQRDQLCVDGSVAVACGMPAFDYVRGMAYAVGSGRLYFSQSNAVWYIADGTGIVRLLAGTPHTEGLGADGAAWGAAQFASPFGLAVDAFLDDVYLADPGNKRVWVIKNLTRTVTTYVGTGAFGTVTPVAAAATFQLLAPLALAIDAESRVLYISDFGAVPSDIDSSDVGVTAPALVDVSAVRVMQVALPAYCVSNLTWSVTGADPCRPCSRGCGAGFVVAAWCTNTSDLVCTLDPSQHTAPSSGGGGINTTLAAAVGAPLAALVLAALVGLCCCVRAAKKQVKRMANSAIEAVAMLPDDVSQGAMVGEGFSSLVCKSVWHGTEVAHKILKDQSDSAVNLELFKNELAMNMLVGNHPRVVSFLGSCSAVGHLFFVFEFMPYGSMEDLLLRDKKLPIHPRIPSRELLNNLRVVSQILVDCSSAVLHCHSKGIIHRDIAARNFLVDTFYRATVCDFGISVALKTGEYSSTFPVYSMIPLKWAAPEALISKVISAETDVWSFGMMMVEVVTRNQPYPHLKPLQVADLVTEGPSVPALPGSCPREWAALIQGCCEYWPERRPKIAQINERLNAFLSACIGVGDDVSRIDEIYQPLNAQDNTELELELTPVPSAVIPLDHQYDSPMQLTAALSTTQLQYDTAGSVAHAAALSSSSSPSAAVPGPGFTPAVTVGRVHVYSQYEDVYDHAKRNTKSKKPTARDDSHPSLE